MEEDITKLLTELSEEARDLYLGDHVDVRDGPPKSAFDFYRKYVSQNRPVLFKGAAKHWPAVDKWRDNQYFREKIGSTRVTVALTPNGYADGVTEGHFVTPLEEDLAFADFLDLLEDPDPTQVPYVQKQNSNLTTELATLLADVSELAWAREAFAPPTEEVNGQGAEPDAINFWMGDGRAITSTHKDPYENIYCVVRGHKDFTLFPPSDVPWMEYRDYPQAAFVRNGEDGRLVVSPAADSDPISWISADPLSPDPSCHPDFCSLSSPRRVRVEAGDALYLPALWFHHLTQSHGCVAVNFWYDMNFDHRYTTFNLLAGLDKLRKRNRNLNT